MLKLRGCAVVVLCAFASTAGAATDVSQALQPRLFFSLDFAGKTTRLRDLRYGLRLDYSERALQGLALQQGAGVDAQKMSAAVHVLARAMRAPVALSFDGLGARALEFSGRPLRTLPLPGLSAADGTPWYESWTTLGLGALAVGGAVALSSVGHGGSGHDDKATTNNSTDPLDTVANNVPAVCAETGGGQQRIVGLNDTECEISMPVPGT